VISEKGQCDLTVSVAAAAYVIIVPCRLQQRMRSAASWCHKPTAPALLHTHTHTRTQARYSTEIITSTFSAIYLNFSRNHYGPSVLWHCWLVARKNIRPVNIDWWGDGVVICLQQGTDCLHMVTGLEKLRHGKSIALLTKLVVVGQACWRHLYDSRRDHLSQVNQL